MKNAGREIPFFVTWKNGVMFLTCPVDCSSSVPRSGRSSRSVNVRAVLPVEGRNTGAVVADPNRAIRRRDRHAPRIDKVRVDVFALHRRRRIGSLSTSKYPRAQTRREQPYC